jgi:hypothetical protein
MRALLKAPMKAVFKAFNPFLRSPARSEEQALPRLGPPLFIVGAPRSGTTFINTVLNRHPKVFITNELRFMLFYHQAVFRASEKLANARAKDDFIEYFKGDIRRQVEAFFLTRITKEKLKTRQKQPLEGLPRIGEGCLWGDKNPFVGHPKYQGLIELMKEVFPDARYVHIYRDPRNAISSRVLRGKTSVESAVSDWRSIFESCRRFGGRIGPGRYHEVKYEALCSEGNAQVVGEVLRFLGLEMHEDVLAFLRQQGGERTPAGTPASGIEDIGDDEVYRKRLDDSQIAVINREVGELLEELHYRS